MNKENTVKRYQCIDALKFLCAFFVVCIHKPFPGTAGQYIVALSRIAVPIFFIITGFFYSESIERNQEKKQIIKLLKLILFSSLLYFVYNFIIGCAKFVVRGNLDFVFEAFEAFNKDNLAKMIFLNESPVAGHLWYLNAIVYVLVCAYILRKAKLFKVLYWITPLLLSVDLIFGKYSLAIFGREWDILYVRNFLFVGIPYFTLGNAIRCAYTKGKLNMLFRKKHLLVIAMVIFTILCVVEKHTILALGINATRDHYISTTLLASVVFVLFLVAFPNENKKLMYVSDIGKKCSLDIYIIHPIIIVVLEVISKILHIKTVYSYVAPMIVFIVSISLSVIYRRTLFYLKNKINERN